MVTVLTRASVSKVLAIPVSVTSSCRCNRVTIHLFAVSAFNCPKNLSLTSKFGQRLCVVSPVTGGNRIQTVHLGLNEGPNSTAALFDLVTGTTVGELQRILCWLSRAPALPMSDVKAAAGTVYLVTHVLFITCA